MVPDAVAEIIKKRRLLGYREPGTAPNGSGSGRKAASNRIRSSRSQRGLAHANVHGIGF
jgi:hypothetical protein